MPISNQSKVTIEEYKPIHFEQVVDLIKRNTPTFFAPEEEKDFKSYLENERELYFVLFSNERLVGCGGINFEEDGETAIISWDMFHPDYQGKSLGTKLMKHRLDIILSLEKVKKIVVRTSQVVYSFYQKQGFETIEVKKDYWTKGFDLYLMEYDLIHG